MSKKFKSTVRLSMFLVLAALAAGVSAQSFSNTDWNTGTWNQTQLIYGGTGNSSSTRVTTGNPGGAVSNFHDHSMLGGGLGSAVFVPSATISAATGANSTITMSLDSFSVAGNAADVHVSFALVQDGTIYVADNFLLDEGSWQSLSGSHVLNDFQQLVFDGSTYTNPLSHPFTGSFAASLTFGFFVWSENGTTGIVENKVDNFNVNVQPVPEPASMIALGLGVAGLLRRRSRKV